MRNLNEPNNYVILMPLKMCCCNKNVDNVVVTCKRNITMTKKNET